MSVTIIGTVALDSIQTPQGSFNRILGGSATYASTAASLFSPVNIVSVIGQDFPTEHMDYLKNRNINTDGIEQKSGDTFHWQGYYTDDMSQAHTVATDLNVLLEFDPIIPTAAQNSRIVFCANIDPILQKKAIQQFHKPELVILDSMNFWIENHLHSLQDTLKEIDVLILNDQELRLLTKIDNLVSAMHHVLTLGPKRVIIKKGEHGAIMTDGQAFFACPAVPLKTLVDPTGAGDSFAGGIAGYLAQSATLSEETFRKALIVGTLIASNTVQDFSLNKLKKLTLEELQTQFKHYQRIATMPETI